MQEEQVASQFDIGDVVVTTWVNDKGNLSYNINYRLSGQPIGKNITSTSQLLALIATHVDSSVFETPVAESTQNPLMPMIEKVFIEAVMNKFDDCQSNARIEFRQHVKDMVSMNFTEVVSNMGISSGTSSKSNTECRCSPANECNCTQRDPHPRYRFPGHHSRWPL